MAKNDPHMGHPCWLKVRTNRQKVIDDQQNIFEWLNDDTRAGWWNMAWSSATVATFYFSDENTAFEFKMRWA